MSSHDPSARAAVPPGGARRPILGEQLELIEWCARCDHLRVFHEAALTCDVLSCRCPGWYVYGGAPVRHDRDA